MSKAADVLSQLRKHLGLPVATPGLRVFGIWLVADGDEATAEALRQQAARDSMVPPEISMTVALAARYGGQIALSFHQAILFLPQGIPEVVPRIALAAGFHALCDLEKDRGYFAMRWTAFAEESEA